ncbi:retrovirus-related pol polyprotein from transposon TNT 1-94 [Tanacetum coccineum]
MYEECSTYGVRLKNDLVVRDFKKFFKEIEVDSCETTSEYKKHFKKRDNPKKRYGEEDDEKVNNETCLVAQASSEVCSESSYFSDENSSIDDLVLDNEYDKLCKMSLKIITKNKRLKATRNNLEKELSVLKEKVSTLEKNKGVDLECIKCHMLNIENEKLKEEVTRLNKFEKSTQCLNEMLSNQKPSGEKLGLGFNLFEASSSGTKEIKFVKAQKKASSDGVDMEPDEWIKDSGCSKHMMGNRKLFSSYKAYNGGNVIFGSNLHGNIIGKGQICDNKCRVTFSEHDSEITNDGKVIGRGIRKKCLYVMKLGNKPKDKICLATIDENSTLWHRKLGYANMCLIQSLASKELVRNLPKLKFDQHFCDSCKIRKQAHASHNAKNIVSTTRCLELLHMDLFGPSAVRRYGGNHYTLVIVDDYSRYTWTRFLKDKTEAFDQFKIFSNKIQNQLGCTIVSIRTDHGREFDNEVQVGEFCNANGITHNFSAPSTPQSNGAVERKIRTLQEMSRTRAILGKTPYELLRGRKPTLDYFRVFGSKCFILNTKEYLTKSDPKSYEDIFLGYSQNSKAYIILNKHTRKVEESLKVTFDETPPPSKTSPLVDDGLDEEEAIKVTEKKNLENDIEDETLDIDEIVNINESRNHPLENVIGNLNQRTLRSQAQNQSNFFCFISTIEPKNVNEALTDDSYNQQEGIDYDETYAPVARLESIRILLAYACALDFKLFQMDVKSAFLNGIINEEVYVAQPSGFINFEKLDHVYKLKKALYGDYVDRKSTSGICTFVGCCLTSWFSKKQTALAISTTEAKYERALAVFVRSWDVV